MLECTNTVTVVHHIKKEDGDTYTCAVYDNASWFSRRTISTSGDGTKPANTYEVRIMGADKIAVSVGDYVALGAVNVAAPSALAGYDHFRVTDVGDNRRGKLAHWRLSGQ